MHMDSEWSIEAQFFKRVKHRHVFYEGAVASQRVWSTVSEYEAEDTVLFRWAGRWDGYSVPQQASISDTSQTDDFWQIAPQSL